MDNLKQEFISFLKELAANQCSYKQWQQYAVTHYTDAAIESARQEIVRICTTDESIGNELWPLTEDAKQNIIRVVGQLENAHS